MPTISDQLLTALRKIAHDAADLSASVQRDETGDLIGGQFTGNGNGGNLSRETLLVKGNLQRSLNDLNALPDSGTEGKTMPAGLKTSRGGYRHPLYARSKRAAPPAVAFTPEEIKARRSAVELDTERFLARIADRDARIAVEGDTDLNHDNVEAAE